MRNYSLTFVYNIYIKKKIQTHNPKYVRLSNSRRPQGDSADTQCPQAPQRKQAKRTCRKLTLHEIKDNKIKVMEIYAQA